MLDTSIFSRTSSGGKEISEKRLLKINYQGSSNYSTLTYDGFGECVKIVETTGGSITSTKQFVRSGNIMREARDASGTLTAQYFGLGQTGTGANYYFHFNQRGDVVGVTDSTGTKLLQSLMILTDVQRYFQGVLRQISASLVYIFINEAD